MTVLLRPDVAVLAPTPEEVLTSQATGRPGSPPHHLLPHVEAALQLLRALAAPALLLEQISLAVFASLYEGEGLNAPETPLARIHPRAQALALYAGTLGPTVSTRISGLFEEGDLALGYLLDAAASLAADRLSQVAAERMEQDLPPATPGERRVLPYSPGYCGWHLSGQRALFATLDPGQIGITLTERCLMRPLKSVTGVLVAAAPETHRFTPTFDFCPTCAARSCVARSRGLS